MSKSNRNDRLSVLRYCSAALLVLASVLLYAVPSFTGHSHPPVEESQVLYESGRERSFVSKCGQRRRPLTSALRPLRTSADRTLVVSRYFVVARQTFSGHRLSNALLAPLRL